MIKRVISIAVTDVIQVINVPLRMLFSHQRLRLFQSLGVSSGTGTNQRNGGVTVYGGLEEPWRGGI